MSDAALTIELDDSTERSLRDLANLWGVPPQEAVRRAVRTTAQSLAPPDRADRLMIFRQLQHTLGLTAARAEQWTDAVREARR